MKTCVNETAEEVIGRRMGSVTNQCIKKSLTNSKKDKKAFIEKKETEAEEAAKKNDSKQGKVLSSEEE